ncbi:MAG TPA: RnfABCDGE type electron transport complex subunit D [Candidatus Saccharimonas sp.]|nr:RnfABCDGE type electron transport complex subunit D [Candidatus Saccharimonas sp.]
MKLLDAFLDRITMYRLLLYYLIGLLAAAAGLGALGILHYQPLDIIISALFLTAVCWLSNKVFAWAFNAPTNVESSFITALILALIITPAHTPSSAIFLAAAGGLAIASKYMLAIRGRHIFNPVAIAVVLTSFGAGDSASWWVGTAPLLPFVLVGGILVVRRIRRVAMTSWYIGATLAVTAVFTLATGGDMLAVLQKEILNTALFFAAFVMLTEPLTSPTTKQKQAWYAGLTGILTAPQIRFGGFYFTPELALLAGNIFSYIVGSRVKVRLHLKERIQLTADSYDFVFTPERPFTYKPGQYMEFTFQHPQTDARGARRYFTLASSPTEPDLRVGVKFYQPSSSYKRWFFTVKPGTPLIAAQLGGDFTLPKDQTRKLAFIAGGIGATPFRSMIKYLLDTNQQRDIAMIYGAKTPADLVYRDVFETARQTMGARITYALGSGGVQPPMYNTRITDSLIKQAIPDFAERLFYISGPHAMVVAAEEALHTLGVPRRNIKKDFFSGY